MDKHYGLTVEYIVRGAGYGIKELAVLMSVNRRTIYNWFQNKNLGADIIRHIGHAIRHDFSIELPELFGSNTSRIFVVEDEEIDIVIFNISLKKVLGHSKVEVHYNGETAISRLLEVSINKPDHLPDYIFLNLNMPVMNGWEFLNEFHRLNIDPFNKTHIYMLSYSIFGFDIYKSKNNPLVKGYLFKPVLADKMRTIFKVSGQ